MRRRRLTPDQGFGVTRSISRELQQQSPCGDGGRVIQNTGPKYLFCEEIAEQKQAAKRRKLRAQRTAMLRQPNGGLRFR
jgi:hypothetical protein